MPSFMKNVSKYRHVVGTEAKKQESIDGVRLTRSAWDSNICFSSESHTAVLWQAGGGAFAVIPNDFQGRLAQPYPLYTGHSRHVLSIDFSPFNSSVLASSSEDCLVKVWQMPDEAPTGNITESAVTLRGHDRKVGSVAWHPTAANVLVTTSMDGTVRAWDVENAAEKYVMSGHEGLIQSMAFNYNGSRIVTTAKDKTVKLWDPRSQSCVSSGPGHAGVKGSRVTWLGNTDFFFTVGFSRSAEREFKIWDSRAMDAPVYTGDIDTSSGIIMPFYDEEAKIVYLAGKGDSNIRIYDFASDFSKANLIAEHRGMSPQRGMSLVPKRSVNVSKNEVAKFMKLEDTRLVPLSFTVPRKAETFQEDLYPPVRSAEANLTAEQWFSGTDADPKTMSLAPGFEAPTAPKVALKVSAAAAKSNEKEPSGKELLEQWRALKKRVEELEKENAALKGQ